MFDKFFKKLDELLEDIDIEITIGQKDPKRDLINSINQMVRFSAIIGGVRRELKNNDFLFSDEKKELENKLAEAEREYLICRKRIAKILNIDEDEIGKFKSF